MNWLVAALAVCAFVPSIHCVEWCYEKPSCNDSTWAVIATQFCNGSRQSPIDIVSASATGDSALTAFTFQNYSSTTALSKIKNTGHTVKIELKTGLQVSGGGLSEPYDALQFHLHWGNGASVPGSEHTVDGKRFPMELHIVNIKSSFAGNVSKALADSSGAAALGFFIEEMAGNETGKPESWRKLSAYLANITDIDQYSAIAAGISMDDLLVGVDRTKYYRYLGSLTTPNCYEIVVWTVFKDTVKVSKDLINLFSNTVYFNTSSTSPLMRNVYRNIQPAQPVTTQASSSSTTAYSLGLMALSLVLGRG